MDASLIQNWQSRIAEAVARRGALRVRGGGSKDFYGETVGGEVIDTRDWRGVVDYEPSELVITARSGTSLTDIENVLAERGQMLAFEPPHFACGATDVATLGGCIAAGLSGPRRASAGAVRDYVLGATLLDGEGCVRSFGGQVMKNVAGFDVSRLLTGSLGTLGIILDVSLKTLPLPPLETTLQLSMSEAEAHAALSRWIAAALPLSASCWHDGVLSVRLSGASAGVAQARARIGGETLLDGAGFWRDLREQQHAFFSGDAPLWRVSLPALADPLPGNALTEWFGAQRWLRDVADPAALRARVAALGGHVTLFRAGEPSSGLPRFQPLPPALLALHLRLKRAFDPRGVFNPGRMYPDF